MGKTDIEFVFNIKLTNHRPPAMREIPGTSAEASTSQCVLGEQSQLSTVMQTTTTVESNDKVRNALVKHANTNLNPEHGFQYRCGRNSLLRRRGLGVLSRECQMRPIFDA